MWCRWIIGYTHASRIRIVASSTAMIGHTSDAGGWPLADAWLKT